jgi:hypothetical protein
MISVWWTLLVFVGGGFAGVLLIALMRAAADLPEQSDSWRWIEQEPIRLAGSEGKFCSFRCAVGHGTISSPRQGSQQRARTIPYDLHADAEQDERAQS